MSLKYSLYALLPDVETNRVYFEFQLILNSKEALFSDEEVSDKFDLNSYKKELKKVDVESNVDSERNAICRVAGTHHVLGQLELSLNVDKSKISIFNVNLGDFEEFGDNYEFDLNADKQIELGFVENSLQNVSSSVRVKTHSISVKFYFSLIATIDNYPKPPERDISHCAIFDRPSADLLSDWVFCGHNHSGGGEGESSHSHAETPETITIPEELYKPIVLDKIEQIIFLLTVKEPLVLLESVDQKDDSIYLQLIKSDEIYSLDCCSSSSTVDSNGDDNGNVNEEKTPEKCERPHSVSLGEHCLVQYKIFAQQNNEQEATAAAAESDDNKSPTTTSSDDYWKKEALKLREYRMSFEVDWFRIEAKLYRELVHLLTDSSQYLRRLLDRFTNLDLPHCHTTTALSPAVLSNYQFVIESDADCGEDILRFEK